MGSLVTRLKHDLQRSPKKAAILGVLFLVAVWFWAPLLMKGKKTPAAKATPETVAVTPQTTTATTAAPPGTALPAGDNTTPRHWTDLQACFRDDYRSQTADLPESRVSPFVGAVSEEETTQPEESQGEPVPSETTPDQLGWIVTSTVVGPRSRLATINGRVYRQGEMICVAGEGSAATSGGSDLSRNHNGIEFVLEEVQPEYVRLSREQKSYQLGLQRRELAGQQPVTERPD